MKPICVIPARKGSKRVPGKNMRLLGCDFSYTYHDDEYRNGHSEKYTSRAINEVMAEVGRLYPEALVAAVDCDREARPVLHEKYPLDLDYITAAEALGVDSGDAVHAP